MTVDTQLNKPTTKLKSPAPEERPKILVVDDEESLLCSLCDVLSFSFSNYDILSASSAEDALGVLKHNQTELVITDLKLPAMNGLELSKKLRQIAPTTNSILMTAYGNQTISNIAKQNGCAAYLEKPFDMDQLMKNVDLALKKAKPISSSTNSSPIRNLLVPLSENTNVLLTKQNKFAEKAPNIYSQNRTQKLSQRTVQSLVNEGIVQFRARNLLEAKKYWTEALELDPICKEAKHNLAILDMVSKLKDKVSIKH